MDRPQIDWRALRVSSATALAAAALLGGVAYGGSLWLEEKEGAYQRARGQLARAANQYRGASDDKAVYEEYASRFRELEEAGMIGPERRLSWVEALQSINDELQLPVLRYQISAQSEVSLQDAAFNADKFRLLRSEMQVRLGALHEGDVLQLLESLAHTGEGLMDSAACRMSRSGRNGGIDYDPDSANLDVTCEVRWYSLTIEPESAR